MRSTRPAGRHLDAPTVLDYLESRLDATGRRAVEEHLARPCTACRDRLRELGWLVERMRLDRVPDVPDALRSRALEVFEPRESPTIAGRGTSKLASLLFDSSAQPLPAAARRVAGGLRRMSYTLGHDSLELESEIESGESRTLSGRLHAPDPSIHRIEIAVGRERFSTWPDASGSFTFDRLPMGPVRVVVTGPHGRYRIPTVE